MTTEVVPPVDVIKAQLDKLRDYGKSTEAERYIVLRDISSNMSSSIEGRRCYVTLGVIPIMMKLLTCNLSIQLEEFVFHIIKTVARYFPERVMTAGFMEYAIEKLKSCPFPLHERMICAILVVILDHDPWLYRREFRYLQIEGAIRNLRANVYRFRLQEKLKEPSATEIYCHWLCSLFKRS